MVASEELKHLKWKLIHQDHLTPAEASERISYMIKWNAQLKAQQAKDKALNEPEGKSKPDFKSEFAKLTKSSPRKHIQSGGNDNE